MTHHAYGPVLLVVALMAAGCGGGTEPTDSPPQRLYKETGALQCSPEGGPDASQARLDAEVDALKRAGADVVSSSCANDSAIRSASCSSESGDLFSVEISSSTVPLAQSLGFRDGALFVDPYLKKCRR